MRTLLAHAIVLLLALWLGSLVQLLLGVSTLFRAFPRDASEVAVEAAPRLFASAERYHLILAGLGVAASVAWRVAVSRRRSATLLVACVIAATAIAGASTLLVSRPMERLRAEGRSRTPEFRRLHGTSSVLYLGQSAFVFGGLLAATASARAGAGGDHSYGNGNSWPDSSGRRTSLEIVTGSSPRQSRG